MLIEHSTSKDVRPRLTREQIESFLPSRGRFRFPAPYDTEGVRLTNEADCPGGVDTAAYSYWPVINKHAGQDELLVMVGCNRQRGGLGPSIFAYHKTTGVVTPRGPLFDESDPLSWATGEGWYFSSQDPFILYLLNGPQLIRYHMLDRSREVVFTAPDGTYLWQAHSSFNGHVHSATLRMGDNERLGAIVYSEDKRAYTIYPPKGSFDECQVDKSGRWLTIKENDDNRIIDLQNEQEFVLRDTDGAVGHSDCGFNEIIGEDDRAPEPGSLRRWRFEANGPAAGDVMYHMVDWASMARHVSYNGTDLIVSCAHRENLPRANEIVLVALDGSLTCQIIAPTMVDLTAGSLTDYDRLPKASIDGEGEYVFWTSNMGTGRLDAFIAHIEASAPLVKPSSLPAHMKVIVIAGTDWDKPNPDWRRQPFTDHTLRGERSREEDWKNVFWEIGDVAGAHCLAIGVRGIFDTDAVAALPVARRAYDASSKVLKVTFWADTVGLGDIVNTPGSGEFKFDFANSQHIQWGWERFVKLVFDHFPREAFLTLSDGRVVIPWWGIEPKTGHGITNQRDAQRLLDEVAEQTRRLGFTGAAHIVDKSWMELCPGLSVYAVHDWFSGHDNPKAYSIRTHNGVSVGMTVPSFFTNINPDGNAQTIARSFELFAAANVNWVLVEGATDWSEAAAVMRDASGSMEKLLVIRQYTQPQSEQPKEELIGDSMIAATEIKDTVVFEDLVPGETDDTWALIIGTEGDRKKVFSLQADGSDGWRYYVEGQRPGAWESGRKLRNGSILAFRTNNHVKLFWIVEGI